MTENPQPKIQSLVENIESIIIGKRESVEVAIIALLSNGHLLLEDLPGVGKTMLARALSRSLDLGFSRIQFTPDLMPSDVTGVSIYNPKTASFDFKPGPIFTNILLADEINRGTPRTQSALLECMAESQVSVDGTTYPLDSPFLVIATQNPIEMQGTYRLPEAQLDRFFMRASLGYPSPADEAKMLESQSQDHPINNLLPVLHKQDVMALQAAVKNVHVSPAVRTYISEIAAATRKHPKLRVGASPRGSLALVRASQARALMNGSNFVDPPIIKSLTAPVLSHRIILHPQHDMGSGSAEAIIEEIVSEIPPPVR